MFEKLKALEDKFNEINEKLMQPETVNNTSLYTSLMKEYKTLTPIVEKFGEYKKAKAANDEAIELLDAGGMDKDFKEMVQMRAHLSASTTMLPFCSVPVKEWVVVQRQCRSCF